MEIAGPISRCAKCGYDLHGLAPDDLCPECGVSIAVSHSRLPPGMSARASNCLKWAWIAYALIIGPILLVLMAFLWFAVWILPLVGIVYALSAYFTSREIWAQLNDSERVSPEGRTLRRSRRRALTAIIVFAIELVAFVLLVPFVFGAW